MPPQSLLDLFRNLRYNHQYMKIVAEDLHERAYMIKSAPFMTHPVPMMIPVYKWWERPVMAFSGKLYDFIAGRRRVVPPSHLITAAEAKYVFPALADEDDSGNSLKGCLVLYDGQQNDTRMNLAIALTAVQYGAVAVNHTAAEALVRDAEAKISGVRIRDTITGDVRVVRAKQVINACGVFSDSVRRMADPDVTDIMVPVSYSVMLCGGCRCDGEQC